MLPPGKSQHVTFTFVGRTNIAARVTALCSVEGGPTYEIALSGEASLINYFLDVTEIDCGLQVPHASLGRGPCLGTVAGALLPT